MSSQISLPGFDSPQKPTDRLFFAVLPENPAASRIEQLTHALRLEHGLYGAAIHAGQLHITLLSLGDHVGLPHDLLTAATHAASKIAQVAFRVRFDIVQTFRNKSRVSGGFPIVLCGGDGVVGLETLYQGLASTLLRLGFKGLPANITPHMTLLYDQQTVPTHTVAPIEWNVREFVLLCRHIDQNRPYSVLGKWPLLNGSLADVVAS
jgi:RNA 2',3'-cyclic 3'-phosphodiesterase